MKSLLVLMGLFTLSCTLPVTRPKTRPRRQLPIGGGFPFFGLVPRANGQFDDFNPVIHIPDPPRPKAPPTRPTSAPARSQDCRARESQSPVALFLIPASDPRASPQAFMIPSLSGDQNASISFPTQIFVLPPHSGQSFEPGGGQLIPPVRPQSGTPNPAGGQAPVIIVPGVFLAAPGNRPDSAGQQTPTQGFSGQPQTGRAVQYSNSDGQYQTGGKQYPTWGGRYPAESGPYPSGGTLYPNGADQYPTGGVEHPPEGGRYPPWSGQYPNEGVEYTPEGGRYPPWAGQYPSGSEQNTAGPGQYPSGRENWE